MACALRCDGVTDSGRYYTEKRRPTLREALQKSIASFQFLTREGPLPSSCASR
ncbi:MAG: hypothetical protein P8X74_06615 [Reinekea sp.]